MTRAYGPARTLFVVLLNLELPEMNTRRSPALSNGVGLDQTLPSADVAQASAFVWSLNQVTAACVEFPPTVQSRPDDNTWGADQMFPSDETDVLTMEMPPSLNSAQHANT